MRHDIRKDLPVEIYMATRRNYVVEVKPFKPLSSLDGIEGEFLLFIEGRNTNKNEPLVERFVIIFGDVGAHIFLHDGLYGGDFQIHDCLDFCDGWAFCGHHATYHRCMGGGKIRNGRVGGWCPNFGRVRELWMLEMVARVLRIKVGDPNPINE